MSDKGHPLSTTFITALQRLYNGFIIIGGEAKNKTVMLRTQNNANNSYYFNTAVNNNNKNNSNLAIPFFDFTMMAIVLRVCPILIYN